MDVNIAVLTAFFAGLVWSLVQMAKTHVPRLAANTDWCPYVAVALGEVCAFGLVAESGLHPGIALTAEWGLVIGASAIASHETGTRLPTVLADLLGYLNVRNFGTATVDISEVTGAISSSSPPQTASAGTQITPIPPSATTTAQPADQPPSGAAAS